MEWRRWYMTRMWYLRNCEMIRNVVFRLQVKQRLSPARLISESHPGRLGARGDIRNMHWKEQAEMDLIHNNEGMHAHTVFDHICVHEHPLSTKEQQERRLLRTPFEILSVLTFLSRVLTGWLLGTKSHSLYIASSWGCSIPWAALLVLPIRLWRNEWWQVDGDVSKSGAPLRTTLSRARGTNYIIIRPASIGVFLFL